MRQTPKRRAKAKAVARPRDMNVFMIVYEGDDSGGDELVMVMARPTNRNAVAKSDGHVNDECGWKGCLMWILILAMVLAVGAAGVAERTKESTLASPGHVAVAPVFTTLEADGARARCSRARRVFWVW